jgi:pyruvate,orthophosphate dikinase
VVPEIMIPLVSAGARWSWSRPGSTRSRRRCATSGVGFHLPARRDGRNAARRAARGEIAQARAFLSFGTNDLTQMTYGLSRDDAGRFMSAYVQQGVFEEDPFHTLDTDGVGELLPSAPRARARQTPIPTQLLSICGEHGGNPESIAFCRARRVRLRVSCSPFRVPVALHPVGNAPAPPGHGLPGAVRR